MQQQPSLNIQGPTSTQQPQLGIVQPQFQQQLAPPGVSDTISDLNPQPFVANVTVHQHLQQQRYHQNEPHAESQPGVNYEMQPVQELAQQAGHYSLQAPFQQQPLQGAGNVPHQQFQQQQQFIQGLQTVQNNEVVMTNAAQDQLDTESLNAISSHQSVSGQALNKTKIIQVGLILQLIASKGDLITYSNALITPFHSHEVPNINILLYYVVVSYNAGLHDQQAPCILVLLERLCQTAAQKGHPIFINSFTIHRLILTTVLVTSKMYNDTYYTNQYIASVGGVTLHNINELERFFMSLIDWQLNISEEEFDFYESGLQAFQQSEASVVAAQLPNISQQPTQVFAAAGMMDPSGALQHHQVPTQPSAEQQLLHLQQQQQQLHAAQVQAANQAHQQQMTHQQNKIIGTAGAMQFQQQLQCDQPNHIQPSQYQGNVQQLHAMQQQPSQHPYQATVSQEPHQQAYQYAAHQGAPQQTLVSQSYPTEYVPMQHVQFDQTPFPIGGHVSGPQQAAETPAYYVNREEQKGLPAMKSNQFGAGAAPNQMPLTTQPQLGQQQLQPMAFSTPATPPHEMSAATNLSMQAQGDLSPPRFDFRQIQLQIEAQSQAQLWQESQNCHGSRAMGPQQDYMGGSKQNK